jgi:hypothetical protein
VTLLGVSDATIKVFEDYYGKADGGRAGYFLGGKVAAGILKLLKDKKKIKAAYDNIFPNGRL